MTHFHHFVPRHRRRHLTHCSWLESGEPPASLRQEGRCFAIWLNHLLTQRETDNIFQWFHVHTISRSLTKSSVRRRLSGETETHNVPREAGSLCATWAFLPQWRSRQSVALQRHPELSSCQRRSLVNRVGRRLWSVWKVSQNPNYWKVVLFAKCKSTSSRSHPCHFPEIDMFHWRQGRFVSTTRSHHCNIRSITLETVSSGYEQYLILAVISARSSTTHCRGTDFCVVTATGIDSKAGGLTMFFTGVHPMNETNTKKCTPRR